MNGIKERLSNVKQELDDVATQLQFLLERQQELLAEKRDLENQLKQSTSAAKVDNKQWDKSDFPWSKKLEAVMQSVFKISRLRPMQLQTMNVTMSGKDCILIMPTGGGKSLCFQLPALLSDGVTLVISPLVSLMEDQVMALQCIGVDATMLNAATSKEDLKQVQDAMTDTNATLKLLYVTPEKLAKSKRFMARLEKMYKMGRFARLVIDEVHCCSQWGHDFRPDYKFLGIMKRQFPDVPMLGLTATATTGVLDDVKKILNIPECQLFRTSFNRPNLFYQVLPKPSIQQEFLSELQTLIQSKFNNQSGIIYTFSRKEAEDLTTELQTRGLKAGCYHADMTAKDRSRVHKAWISNTIQIVVATVAFGMGIDKPDVRFVIHHSLSKSMENLYQESGRAGRDEKLSHCIVYYRLQDVFRQSSMVMAEQTGTKNLYGIMSYCTDIRSCRRSVIAKYFGEVWDKSQCNKMCDHCQQNCEVDSKDVTQFCINVLKIVDQAIFQDQRLTAIKLLDAWQGKGPMAARVKGTDTGTDREKLERILAHMLLKHYLREDFHFTPYATISYLVPGPKAGALRGGMEKVFVDMPSKMVPSQTQQTKSGEPNKTSTLSKDKSRKDTSLKEKGKTNLVFDNEQKSAFTSLVKSPAVDGGKKTSALNDDTKPSLKRKSQSMNLTKRKPLQLDSDSDSDFGSVSTKTASFKKRKSSTSGIKNDQTDTSKQNFSKDSKLNGLKNSVKKPVIIDSDSELEVSDGAGERTLNNSCSMDVNSDSIPIELADSDSDFG